MPIYGYRCTECDHQLEVLQSMSAPPLVSCPECNGKLRKLLYPVGVQFKGSGFYSTDYKSGGPPGPAKTDSEDKPKSEAKTESKSEPASAGSGSGGKGESKGDTK
jgi:putative FmdB family regulatory protein